MPATPTMLPILRFDAERKVVLIRPQDGGQPYVITLKAIKHRIGRPGRLSRKELIEACSSQEPYFAIVAIRKLFFGKVDPDGRAVVTIHDVKAIS